MKRAVYIRILLTLILLPLLYFLSAPPILKIVMRSRNDGRIPRFYAPVKAAWESQVFSPVALWYFNDVWNCQIEVLVEKYVEE
jgi:hypothetical protein